MNSRVLLNQFRDARWTNHADLERFITSAGAISPGDLNSLLSVLVKKRNSGGPETQRLRLDVFQRLALAAQNRAFFTPLVRSLVGADQQVADVLIELLPAVNSVSDHRELVELFKHSDAQVRKLAARAFLKVPGKTAFSQLCNLCAERAFPGRSEALDALLSVGGAQALPALKGTLAAGDTPERIRALRMVSEREDLRARAGEVLPIVKSALNDRNKPVVLNAIAAFGALADEEVFFQEIGQYLDSPDKSIVRATVWAMVRYRSERTRNVLTQRFRAGPNAVRLAVLDAVESNGAPELMDILTEALAHRQASLRVRAAEVLERLCANGTVDSAQAVLWLLRSRDAGLRRTAVDIAKKGRDGQASLWPQLFQYLKEEDWWVRERLSDALVAMGGEALTPYAVAYLDDPSDIIRRYGIGLLVRLNDPNAIGALVRSASDDPDWWVRERAIEALGNLKDKRATPYIIDLMSRFDDLRLIGTHALAEIGDPAAAGHVARLLLDEDLDIQLAGLRCLAALNDPEQARFVQRCAKSTDHRVRPLAKELLKRWEVAPEDPTDQKIEGTISLLDHLLRRTVETGGDDLLLSGGKRPFIKRLGKMVPVARRRLTSEEVEALLRPHLSESQRADLDKLVDIDFSYEVKSEALRFRVNVFKQRGGLSAVFRSIKAKVPHLEELGLPKVVHGFGDYPYGLVLIGGPTGSGKSTTLAAVIDYINTSYPKNVITLEDPVEAVHLPKRALVSQREVGTHTHSFSAALRAALRQDPDVILVGEMRDVPTLYSALIASETGHLVFGTVHTASADTTVDRIINAFPMDDQPQVRSILSNNLRAICCQHLLKRIGGGRVLAVEVMLNNDAIANLIRRERTFQIPTVIATSQEAGMVSMDNALFELVKKRQVSAEDAYMKAMSKTEFAARLLREPISDEFVNKLAELERSK